MISIIIPTYNRNAELNYLLEKLNSQIDNRFEVIIIDDFSNKPNYIDKDRYKFEISYYRNEFNKGPSESRNIGASKSKYDWLCFLDDDDFFLENKIKVLLSQINKNKGIELFYHRAKINLVNEKRSYITSIGEPKGELRNKILESNFIGGAPVIAIRKDTFIRLGGFDYKLKAIEDYDFAINCILNNVKIKMIDKVLIECNLYTKRNSVSKNISNTIEAFNFIYNKYNFTDYESKLLQLSRNRILSYAYTMNLSRNSSKYYFKIFLSTMSMKFIFASILSFVNPKFVIYMRSKKNA